MIKWIKNLFCKEEREEIVFETITNIKKMKKDVVIAYLSQWNFSFGKTVTKKDLIDFIKENKLNK